VSPTKRCWVAYAAPAGEFLCRLELPVEATVADALAAARGREGERPAGLVVPWAEAPVGIFGERVSRETVFRDGDRIELYRPLALDPRARRRARVAAPPRRR